MNCVEYGKQNPSVLLLLHGGGLSWWNYRDVALLLQEKYHVIIPILDGHADSDAAFTSIEENAARIIAYIDTHFDGKIFALCGLSLGGQIAAEILSLRPDICRYCLLESTAAKPSRLTSALIGPTFQASFPLIQKQWFAKLQAAYLKIPGKFFEDYYRDTCKISLADMIAFLKCSSSYRPKAGLGKTSATVHILYGSKENALIRSSAKILNTAIPNSKICCLPGLSHGQLSLCQPQQYVHHLLALLDS